MRFEEIDKSINVTNIPTTFVYFLLKCNEVVYVGQTKKGMTRPLVHKYDKDFDEIYIMPCGEKMLDLVESEYIVKYSPLYNKALKSGCCHSLRQARNLIRNTCNLPDYTIRHLRDDCYDLKIIPATINGKAYITHDDLQNIMNVYEGIIWQCLE